MREDDYEASAGAPASAGDIWRLTEAVSEINPRLDEDVVDLIRQTRDAVMGVQFLIERAIGVISFWGAIITVFFGVLLWRSW